VRAANREDSSSGVSWADHVVISELATGSDKSTKDEFLELYNPTPNIIDISEWRVQTKGHESRRWTTKMVVPVGTKIQPYSFFLIVNGVGYQGPKEDLAKKFQYGLFGEEGSVRLIDYDGNEVDKLGYGINAPDFEAATIENEGASLSRRDFGVDTDNNKKDFTAARSRAPQNSYSLPEIPGSTVFPNVTKKTPQKPDSPVIPDSVKTQEIEVGKLYREAKADWRAKKMLSCIGKLERVLEVDPNNGPAKKDMRDIPLKIKSDLEKRKYVGRDQYYSEAVIYYLEGNYNSAVRNLQKILLLTPDDMEVKEWYARISGILVPSNVPAPSAEYAKPIPPQTGDPAPRKKAKSAKTAVTKKSEPPSKEELTKANSYYEQGLKEYAAGKVSEAIASWEICIKFNPEHEKAKLALSKAQKSMR